MAIGKTIQGEVGHAISQFADLRNAIGDVIEMEELPQSQGMRIWEALRTVNSGLRSALYAIEDIEQK